MLSRCVSEALRVGNNVHDVIKIMFCEVVPWVFISVAVVDIKGLLSGKDCPHVRERKERSKVSFGADKLFSVALAPKSSGILLKKACFAE